MIVVTPRFSIRWLLGAVAVVVMAIYVLVIRPPIVARNFIKQIHLRLQVDSRSLKDQYFGDIDPDGACLEVQVYPRHWNDILTCRQFFTISFVQEDSEKNERSLVPVCDFYATPLGIHEHCNERMLQSERDLDFDEANREGAAQLGVSRQ